jgi:hypothetical protein
MKKDQIVAYKDSSRFITNGCGLVVDKDTTDSNCVWIRWNCEPNTTKEYISELREI